MERPLSLRSIVIANLGLLVMITMWGTFFPLLEFVLKTWDPMSATIGRHLMAVVTLLAAIMLRHREFPPAPNFQAARQDFAPGYGWV